jgi:hypothetical protein
MAVLAIGRCKVVSSCHGAIDLDQQGLVLGVQCESVA